MSDLDLHCLLNGISIQNKMKMNILGTPKTELGLIQYIRLGNPIRVTLNSEILRENLFSQIT